MSSRELHEMEDEDYFEKDGEDENGKEEPKPSTPATNEKEEEAVKGNNEEEKKEPDAANQLEENLKSSVDTITKIRGAIKNKSKEPEETQFKFNRSLSNSSERSTNSIKIQITLGGLENNNSNGSESGENKSEDERLDNRENSQELAEEAEQAETTEPELQKKVKLS